MFEGLFVRFVFVLSDIMKFASSTYRVVLLCECMMMWGAGAASILAVAQDVDHSKCSLDYIRRIVMESCIRPVRFRRDSRALEPSHENAGNGIDVSSQHHSVMEPPLKRSILHLPHHLLPLDSTLVIRRKQRRGKRNLDSQYDVYFHFCCNHMDICENLECP